MSPVVARLVAWCCDPERREEIAGDLEELHARRVRRLGVARAAARTGVDLASVCVRQSRVRGWSGRRWAVTGAVLATLAAGGAGAPDLPADPYTITATDAGGTFTLDLHRGRVLAATLNGIPLAAERIVQHGARLILRGADRGVDLEVAVTSDGGIAWAGRRAPPANQETPINLAWALEYLAQLATASAADGSRLWGVPLYGPLLLVDRATRFVVANEPDSAGVLQARDGAFVGTWPDEENIANTAVTWGGKRWTMLVWPVPSQRYAGARLGFHELFHRVQPDLGISTRDAANAHLAARDARIWLRLEWRALAEALVRDGPERRAAIGDALAFRARRHALFPDGAADERALELNEGLAEYTGLKLSGLPAGVLADRAAVELENREGQESLSRSFAYASGPALGVLLDESGRSWRPRVTPETDLAALLREAYGLSGSGPVSDLDARARRYGAERVIAQEAALAERIAAVEARYRARLIDGPTLTLPVGARFRYSFDPNAVTPLAGLGTAYEGARVTDEWGVLSVASGGVLLRRGAGLITGVVVPVADGAPEPPRAGEGWRLELAEGWTVAAGDRPGSWVVRRAP